MRHGARIKCGLITGAYLFPKTCLHEGTSLSTELNVNVGQPLADFSTDNVLNWFLLATKP